jgi:hypothetical protein
VVKVPDTLGNVEKSYTPVMVTGTGVGVEADAESTEPIAKQPSTTRIVANVMFNFFIFNFPFVCCFGLLWLLVEKSFLAVHHVLRENWPAVTQNCGASVIFVVEAAVLSAAV